jgi:serine/threonine protein kinase
MSFAIQEYLARIEAFETASGGPSVTLLVAKTSRKGAGNHAGDDDDSSPAALRFEVGVRELMTRFTNVEEIGFRSRSFCFTFAKPLDAVCFALLWHAQLRQLRKETGIALFDQTALHATGQSHPESLAGEGKRGHYRTDVTICTQLAELGGGTGLFLSREVFDAARGLLKKDQVKDLSPLVWMNHGPYLLKDIQSPIEICAVAEGSSAEMLRPPADKTDSKRDMSQDELIAWGWRPALGASVPGTRCVLDERMPDGRFGEVWLGHDEAVKDKRTFRFCFRKDWAAALKVELPALEIWKRKSGENRNLLGLFQISVDQPPYFMMTEFFEGKSLDQWAKDFGGVVSVPFATRVEIIAQAAAGLQSAHDGKIVHGDLRPENLIVFGSGATPKDVQVKVADFRMAAVGPKREPVQIVLPAPPAASPDAPPPEPKVVFGNPYEAPEVAAGQAATSKSDIYSIGILLCQLILADLTAGLPAERIKEILEVVKRPSLLPFFAENPQERTDGAAKVARELRSVLKDRDARVTFRAGMSRRQLVGTIVLTVLLVVGAALVIIVGPENMFSRKKTGTEESAAGKKSSSSPTPASSGQSSSRTVDESELTPVPAGESGSGGGSRGGVSRSRRTFETESESTKSLKVLFKFMVLPLIVVIIVGTVFQRFGSHIRRWMGRPE